MFVLKFFKFLFKIITGIIWWLIRSILKIAIIVVMILSLITIGGYVYVRERLEFDPYDTVRYSYILAEQVDETLLCPNAFSADDMAEVQLKVNSSVADMITFTEENGYVISFGELGNMSQEIKISDRQLGAFAQKMIEQETESKIQAGDYVLDFELKQIDISKVKKGDADFNAVIKLDITPIKESLRAFPVKYLKDILPDYLFISSTVGVETGETGFDYTIIHRSLTVNNLDEFETEDLFRMLDAVMGTERVDQLNVQIAKAVWGVLIGDESQNGLVYSLKDNGATGFKFDEEDAVQYFLITKNNDQL